MLAVLWRLKALFHAVFASAAKISIYGAARVCLSLPALLTRVVIDAAIHRLVKLLVSYKTLAGLGFRLFALDVKRSKNRFQASKHCLSYCLAVLRRFARLQSHG